MKTLKAYTFEELLCEIPELELFKHTGPDLKGNTMKAILTRFCRANGFKSFYTDLYVFENIPHFLFEKL